MVFKFAQNQGVHVAKQRRKVIVIGAGPGGICAGIKLLEAGYNDFLILEKAPNIGGTWWYNRYPGAACDVPSHLYSFSFETQYDWCSPYASAPEILRYMQHCADKYGVSSHVRCNTQVESARWLEEETRWFVKCADGDEFSANVLIAAQGMFNDPQWPDIAGLDDFAGTMFHTARWDHAQDLHGARVGIVGSAASAVQCVPPTAELAQRLTVFQRTPNWVLPKKDRPYPPEKRDYLRSNPDGIEHNRQRFFEAFDGFELLNDPQRYADTVQLGLDNIALVQDPTTRAQLTPDYPFGCKRILLSSNYFPTFNRDNVDLVTGHIDSINSAGLKTADGRQHDCDVLVIATGFHVSRYASSIDIVGRAQGSLTDAWNDGAQAYLGITTSNFPNLFQLYGPNTNKGSILYMLECQTDYVVQVLQHMDANAFAWIDVRKEVMQTYNDEIQRDANAIAVWSENCNNYFRHPGSGRVVTQYPRTMSRYRLDLCQLDENDYVFGAMAV